MSAFGTKGTPSDSPARSRRRSPRFAALAALGALLSVAVLAGTTPASTAQESFVSPATRATSMPVQADRLGGTDGESPWPDAAAGPATPGAPAELPGRIGDRFPSSIDVPGTETRASTPAEDRDGPSFLPLVGLPGTVSGTVRGPGNAIALGGCVTLFSYDGTYVEAIADGCVDGSGDFSFSAPSGTYRLLYEGFVDGSGNPLVDEWYSDATTVESAASVVVAGGATLVLNAVLGAGQNIRFYTGAYYGGCVTVYNSSGGLATQHCGTGTELNYIGLPPGAYVFYFSGYTSSFGDLLDSWYRGGGYTAYVPGDAEWVVLGVGQELDVNPALRLALHTVRGTVTLADGAEMDGWVGVYQGTLSGPLLGWAWANPDGTYEITGLPLGESKAVRFASFTGAADEWGRPTWTPGQGAPSWGTALKWGTTDNFDVVNADLETEGTISGDLLVPDDFTSGSACVYAFDPLYAYGEWRSYYVGGYCGNVGEPFVIHHLRSWDYRLEFVDPGNSAAADAWYLAKPTLDLADDVSVLEGATTTIFPVWDVPTVGSISLGYGPPAGGTTVTVTGSHFTGATSVTFGGVAGTSLSVGSDTSLTVVTPAGTDLRAEVVVTNAVGDSLPAAAAFFAYTDSSVVAGIPEVIADVSNFTQGVVRCYQVTGKAGVPVGAVGVILNVTASLPSSVGHVRVYPDYLNNGASPAPAVSTVNFEVGRDVANSTTIALPTDGKVCVYSVGGPMARMILDVDGYILPGSGITLITPEKLVDTRSLPWVHVGPISGPVHPMIAYHLQVGGKGSVPSDAVAVIANITVVDTTSPGHLRMWASDQLRPNTSVVNYAPETKANSQIVALSADGRLTFLSYSYVPTSASPVQVLIDVTGYIEAGSDFVATVPTKIVESRPAYGIVGPIPGALAPGVVYPVPVGTSVVPAGATAVVLNVTAVQPTNFGHIRVYPDTNGLGTTPPPVMSNLNFIPGRDIPNMVIVQLPANRTIDFYTAYAGGGSTDLLVNVIGYIAGPAT